jgi:hypothetical protein
MLAGSIALGIMLARWCLPGSFFAPLLGVALFLAIYLLGMQAWIGAMVAIAGKEVAKGLLRSLLRGVWNIISGRRERKLRTLTDEFKHPVEFDEATIKRETTKAVGVFRNLGISLGRACGLPLGLIGIYDPKTQIVLSPAQIAFLDRYFDTVFWFAIETSQVVSILLLYTVAGWLFG